MNEVRLIFNYVVTSELVICKFLLELYGAFKKHNRMNDAVFYCILDPAVYRISIDCDF